MLELQLHIEAHFTIKAQQSNSVNIKINYVVATSEILLTDKEIIYYLKWKIIINKQQMSVDHSVSSSVVL